MTIKFENDTEERFWREVYTATIKAGANFKIGGKTASVCEVADQAVELLRNRQKEKNPYKESA